MKQIQLTLGKVTLVDDDIYEVVKNYKWYAWSNFNIFYALRSTSRKIDPNGKQHVIRLHHVVIGEPPKGMVVDHKDGNGLNNQRDNLQIVTNRKNQQNRINHRKGKLVGCYYDKRDKYWVAQIRIDGKLKGLGYFKTEQEAHETYLKALDNLK